MMASSSSLFAPPAEVADAPASSATVDRISEVASGSSAPTAVSSTYMVDVDGDAPEGVPLVETSSASPVSARTWFKSLPPRIRHASSKVKRFVVHKAKSITRKDVAEHALSRVPLIRTVATYKPRAYFAGDMIAGLSIATILIPQSIAYAGVAGLPAVYGLYSAFVPMAIYAIFGTCQQLNVAPVSVLSLVVFQALNDIVTYKADPARYIANAIYLTLLTGIIQVLMGVLRLGFLMRYFSPAVVTGFISGAAFGASVCSQLPSLFGVTIPATNYCWMIIYYVCVALPQTKWLAITMSILTIAIIVVVRKWKRAIPIAFIMVVINTFISWCLVTYNHSTPALPIVGTIPSGLPTFKVPTVASGDLGQLIASAFLCVAIGYMESYSLALKMGTKHGYKVDANQEMIALGSANLVGSFFQSYPVTGSFSRTAECDLQGGKTILYSVVCVVTVIISLLFLTSVFYFIPKSTLGAVIVSAAYRLIDIKKMKIYYRTNKFDFWVCILTFSAVILAGTEVGLAIGLALSFGAVVVQSAAPYVAHLGFVPLTDKSVRQVDAARFPQATKSDEVAIVRFDSALTFLNNVSFLNLLRRITTSSASMHVDAFLFESNRPPLIAPSVVIVDGSGLTYTDTTGAKALVTAAQELRAKGIHLLFAGIRSAIKDVLSTLGVIDEIGHRNFFLTVDDAVAYVYQNSLTEKKPILALNLLHANASGLLGFSNSMLPLPVTTPTSPSPLTAMGDSTVALHTTDAA